MIVLRIFYRFLRLLGFNAQLPLTLPGDIQQVEDWGVQAVLQADAQISQLVSDGHVVEGNILRDSVAVENLLSLSREFILTQDQLVETVERAAKILRLDTSSLTQQDIDSGMLDQADPTVTVIVETVDGKRR